MDTHDAADEQPHFESHSMGNLRASNIRRGGCWCIDLCSQRPVLAAAGTQTITKTQDGPFRNLVRLVEGLEKMMNTLLLWGMQRIIQRIIIRLLLKGQKPGTEHPACTGGGLDVTDWFQDSWACGPENPNPPGPS